MKKYILNKQLNKVANFLLLNSVIKLYPKAVIANSVVNEYGFYLDFENEKTLVLSELSKLEEQINDFINSGYKVVKANEDQAQVNKYQKSIIKERALKNVYCLEKKDHQNSASYFYEKLDLTLINNIKHLKLLNVGGAYWEDNKKNKQLTRISGVAFDSQEELENYLAVMKDNKERDHRKLGKELNIFTGDVLSGQGFPFWLEDGMIIKKRIQEFLRQKEIEFGFTEVHTPAFGATELYRKSGHLTHYTSDMYPPIKVDHEELMMRPMTCPHHLLIYMKKNHSYRELPIRLSEHAQLYRYEKSGALIGLERVRAMELTDAHIFIRKDQILDEIVNCYTLIKQTLETFDIKIDHIALSLRDKINKEKFYDDDKMWEYAEETLETALNELGVDYIKEKGEAAFYGPKIDIQVKTALNKVITLSTIQLDFLLPNRFKAFYLDKDLKKQQPIIVHRGLIGTYERFIAILLEQTKGVFPFWLAPRQFVIIPINKDKHTKFAKEINQKLLVERFSSHVDFTEESLGKKLRNAQKSKAKYQIIIGDEEVETNTLNLRAYGEQSSEQISWDDLLKKLKKLR